MEVVTCGVVGENCGDVLSVTIIVVVVDVCVVPGVVVVLELVDVDGDVVVGSASPLTSSSSPSAGGVITLAEVVVATLPGNTTDGRNVVSLVSVIMVGVSVGVLSVVGGMNSVVSISSSVVMLVGSDVVVVVLTVAGVGVVVVVLVIGFAVVVVVVVELILVVGCGVEVVVVVLAVVVGVGVDGLYVDDDDKDVVNGVATDAVDGDGFGVGRAGDVLVGVFVDNSTALVEQEIDLVRFNQ